MADDLVQFLRDRYDEDEQTARAATAGPWRHDANKHHHIAGTPLFEEAVFAGLTGADATCVAGTGETDDPQGMRDAAHIARHDPARVLADVAAKRRIVEQADLYLCDSGPMCGYRTKHGHNVLLLLALPYADHPDYREDWRP